MAVSDDVHIHGAAGSALPTRACAVCGSRSGASPIRIPRSYPVGLLCAIALALPLVLALVIGAIWGPHDLFDIMTQAGDPRDSELRLLRALPVIVAALWSALAVIGIEVFCRRAGLSLSLCRPCATVQRWRRVKFAMVLVFAFIALAVLLYLAAAPALDDRKWGMLFAPWIILAALVANWTPLAGVRCCPLSDTVQQICGASAAARVIGEERSDVIAAAARPGIWPPRIELVSWVVAATIVGIAILAPRLERFPLECAYGTYPLSYRSNDARVVGCRTPDGSAHGYARGEAGAWGSGPDAPGYHGRWWFGTPHGDFTFLDKEGRARAQGRFVAGQARGRWTISDESGAILEELEVLTGPVRVIVHRAHPHLNCSRSEIESTGMPAWGTRACPRYGETAPFVRVENARVVESGMR